MGIAWRHSPIAFLGVVSRDQARGFQGGPEFTAFAQSDNLIPITIGEEWG